MKRSISLSTKKLFIPIVLSIIAITFFSIRTDTFSSAANYATILREMATPLLISCGMCFVMASGYIDLSVGAIAGFLCMLASRMIDWGLPIIIVLLLMVVVGTMCGLINSIVLHRFNLNPFVGTLAMQNVYRGLVWVISYRYANGSAYSVRITDQVYAVTGDGELPEGSNWEAAAAAGKFGLDNLTVFVDNNGLQISGRVTDVMNMEDIQEKFRAFGWGTTEIDGNDMEQVLAALDSLPLEKGRPSMVLCHTVKAKGLKIGEDRAEFHFWNAKPEELDAAEQDLNEQIHEMTRELEATR